MAIRHRVGSAVERRGDCRATNRSLTLSGCDGQPERQLQRGGEQQSGECDQCERAPDGVCGDWFAEALDTTNVVWATGGNAAWFGTTGVTHDGVDAAQSGPLAGREESWMETSVTGLGWCVFGGRRRPCTQQVAFIRGRNEWSSISGETDWRQETVTLGRDYRPALAICEGMLRDFGPGRGWVDQV